jgi:nicotinate-nucleotide adenylyltransferase
MRAAFFGGSFDPPHRGHLAIARAAIERLSLDLVWMAPAGHQPLKQSGEATPYEYRLAMVELAVAGEPRIVASAADAPRADGRPNYTIDVLLRLKEDLAGEDRLFFLLGADAFLTLRQWYRSADLLMSCDLIVAGRPGFSIEELPTILPEGIQAEKRAGSEDSSLVVPWALIDQAGQHSTLYLMPDLQEDIAATEIRAAIAGEGSARDVLPTPVLRYIEEMGLYR